MTTLRPLCYQVAVSLDGFLAGRNGEFDWIPMDPDIDFAALFARFDALVMGRRTWEVAAGHGGGGFGLPVYVASRTLSEPPAEGVTLLRGDVPREVAALKALPPKEPGRQLWLYGGGVLFAALLDAGLVDTVELAVVPVLLGGGLPFLAATARRHPLRLQDQRVYPKTGTVMLTYAVGA